MNKNFILKEVDEIIATDVLVIGAGGAGIKAAITTSDIGKDVIVLSKGTFTKTGSTFFPLISGWDIQFLPENIDNVNSKEYFLKEILEIGERMATSSVVRHSSEE